MARREGVDYHAARREGVDSHDARRDSRVARRVGVDSHVARREGVHYPEVAGLWVARQEGVGSPYPLGAPVRFHHCSPRWRDSEGL